MVDVYYEHAYTWAQICDHPVPESGVYLTIVVLRGVNIKNENIGIQLTASPYLYDINAGRTGFFDTFHISSGTFYTHDYYIKSSDIRFYEDTDSFSAWIWATRSIHFEDGVFKAIKI